ncbi:MAG TPA: class I SAM-dependent methyltransferase [Pseudonocardiaceae bacterium]
MVRRPVQREQGREQPREQRVIPSPNIWSWPEIYEAENRAQDADGAIWQTLRQACPWDGARVVDIGCGDGFHLPVFARTAATVTGIEPVGRLVARARQRVAGLPNVTVRVAHAQATGLPAASIDLVHARTAYFFGTGCEPGLVEADRILRPGGALAIVDLDATAPPYGAWMRAAAPRYDPHAARVFFERRGFSTTLVDTVWRFDDRVTLESVLRIEFSPKVAARAIAETVDLTIPVRYRIQVRLRP